MNIKKRIYVILSIVLMMFCLPVYAAEISLVSPNTLAIWGYHPLNRLTYLKTYCDKWQDRSDDIIYQAIKSNKPIGESSNTFYRYTLIREHYQDQQKLKARLSRLRNPNDISSKHAKLCNIRKIFTQGEYIYLVHTDAGIFSDAEMLRVYLLFKRAMLKDTD